MLNVEEGGSKRSPTNILLWHEEDKGHFSAFSKLTCLDNTQLSIFQR